MLHFHTLEVAEVRPETEHAVAVTFAVPEALAEQYRFVQGQHLALRTRIDGEEVRRTYSICSGVSEGVLRVAIKRQPGGLFSNYANERLAAGDKLDVLTPTGTFHTPLSPEHQNLYAAFAAGSGITPVLSILKSTLDAEPRSRFLLFYGNRSRSTIMFREELEDLKNRHIDRLSLHHFLSRQHRDTELYNGHLDAEKTRLLARTLLPASAVDAYFLCGPATLIEDVSGALRAEGVAAERLHFERFTTGAQPAAAPRPRAAPTRAAGHACAVTVIVDGVRSQFAGPFDGVSVLDAALEQGIELPFSCKSGVCTTCRAKLREGEVDMAANYGLEPHELDAGFVLTCQSRPLSERLVLDFDATG